VEPSGKDTVSIASAFYNMFVEQTRSSLQKMNLPFKR
jgi:hypothetical protein